MSAAAACDVGFFRLRKTIGGHSAKLGKKSQDAYLLVFKKVFARSPPHAKDFEHILSLPASLSEFIDLQIAQRDLHAEGVSQDEVPLEESPDLPAGSASAAAADAKAIKNELCRYAYQRLRPVLPLLIGCHSNDPKLLQLCLEGLHHFSMIGTCSTLGKTVDPVVDCFLTRVFEGSLASWASCLHPLLDILMKILGTYDALPQASLLGMLGVLSSLHELVYRLEDAGYGVHDHMFELLTTVLNSIMSLIQVPPNEANSQEEEEEKGEKEEEKGEKGEKEEKQEKQEKEEEKEESPDMTATLLAFASKLESLGGASIEALSPDLLTISAQLFRDPRWQNEALYLLLLVFHCRKFGRVAVGSGAEA